MIRAFVPTRRAPASRCKTAMDANGCVRQPGRRTILVRRTVAGAADAGDRAITLEAGHVVDVAPLADAAGHPNNCAAPVAASIARDTWRGRIARMLPIAAKEVRDGLTNRWLLAYSILLGGLGLAATATGIDSASGLAIQAFGRTTATLMNLCLLLSPLVAVVMGAALIAGEQEKGTLEHLLAQPLTRTELLLGKHLGLLTALTTATVVGFIPAGLVITGSGPGGLGNTCCFQQSPTLAERQAAVGIMISVTSRSAVQPRNAMVTCFAFFCCNIRADGPTLAVSE